MGKTEPDDRIERIRRDYAKLIARGEAKIALLREKRHGAPDTVMAELDVHIGRCEALVQSMRHGFTVVQDYRSTWVTPKQS